MSRQWLSQRQRQARRARQERDRGLPKCGCGNIAGLGQAQCGRCRDEAAQRQQANEGDGGRRAAMCIYCGDAVIYDTHQVTDMAAAHEQLVAHDQSCPKNPLVRQRDALLAFARAGIVDVAFEGGSWEGCDIQEVALKAGLLCEVPFDPEVHTGPAAECCEPGDTIYELTDLMRGSPEKGAKREGGDHG